MPAYFCLSGAVFSIELKKNKYPSVFDLIKCKARRLLLPLLFVWICWNIPIKMFSHYYERLKYPFIAALEQIPFPYCVYLWFIEALFFIFILDYYIEKISNIKTQSYIVFALFLIGIVFSRFYGSWNFLGNPFEYLIWFWLGHYIDRFIRKLHNKIKIKRKAWLCIEFAIFLATFLLARPIPHGYFILNITILPFIGTIWVWDFSGFLADKFCNKKSAFLKISSYTYGIYLWAEPLNYIVLFVFYSVFGVRAFLSAAGSFEIWITRIVFSVFVALTITKILQQVKFPIKAY